MARDACASEAGRASRQERKKVEMLFAHRKRILKLDRLRLRGPDGARDEFVLAAAAQNLRELAKLILPAAAEPSLIGRSPRSKPTASLSTKSALLKPFRRSACWKSGRARITEGGGKPPVCFRANGPRKRTAN
jgi:hypothetical protein